MGFQEIRTRTKTRFREEVPVPVQAGTSESQKEPQVITEINVSQNFLCLDNKPKKFYAGKISKFFHNWTKLTKDKFILNVIQKGYEIEFELH